MAEITKEQLDVIKAAKRAYKKDRYNTTIESSGLKHALMVLEESEKPKECVPHPFLRHKFGWHILNKDGVLNEATCAFWRKDYWEYHGQILSSVDVYNMGWRYGKLVQM